MKNVATEVALARIKEAFQKRAADVDFSGPAQVNVPEEGDWTALDSRVSVGNADIIRRLDAIDAQLKIILGAVANPPVASKYRDELIELIHEVTKKP